MRLCIIMLPHEMMVADEWYNKGSPQFCSKHGHEQSAHRYNSNIFAARIHWKKMPMNVCISPTSVSYDGKVMDK